MELRGRWRAVIGLAMALALTASVVAVIMLVWVDRSPGVRSAPAPIVLGGIGADGSEPVRRQAKSPRGPANRRSGVWYSDGRHGPPTHAPRHPAGLIVDHPSVVTNLPLHLCGWRRRGGPHTLPTYG